MFKFDFFVDDKHVVPLLHRLNGIAHDLVVVPVGNAEPAPNGTVKAKVAGTTQLDMFRGLLDETPVGSTIRRSDVSALLVEHGGNPSSGGGLLKQAVKLGWIKTNGSGRGNRVSYTVQKGGSK